MPAASGRLVGLVERRPSTQDEVASVGVRVAAVDPDGAAGVVELVSPGESHFGQRLVGGRAQRDQELDEAIRDAISGLATWLPTSVRGQRVTPLRRFQRANFGRLKTSVHDLSPDSAPKELDLAQDVSGQGLELEELLALGGPRHADLVAHLEALSHGGDPLTIARAFERGGAHLKRPVEIFGYQEIAAGQGQSPTADLEQVRAVRPDGTAREFIVSTTPVYGSVPKENHV